jgi:imidazolonepropionase-like amidohydrolase
MTAYALVGGTLIDGTGGDPVSPSLILIDNGRVIYAGPEKAFDADRFQARDMTGKWIIPGLIDTNVHLILTTVPEFFVKYEDQLEDIALQSAQVGLKYGMTTMADTWGPLEPLLAARDRIRAGEFIASDVLIAGNILGTGGPFSSNFMGSWPLSGSSLKNGDWVHSDIRARIDALWEAGVGPEMVAMTPDEVGAAVSKYIARGVDFVKVGVSAHGIEPVEPLLFSEEALEAIRREVRVAGLPLQTHTFSVESLRLALKMKPDLLQHPNVMSRGWAAASEAQRAAIREMIEQIASNGTLSALMAIPEKRQLAIYQNWTSDQSRGDAALDELMLRRRSWFEGVEYADQVEGLQEWLQAGVRFTIATDQGPEASDLGPTVWGRLGRAHFDRMVGLQDAGVRPMDILVAATRNGAEAYGLLADRGTLETGKRADLLVLGQNPLEDIGHVRSIEWVMKNGAYVDREALPTIKVLDYDPAALWPW